MKHFILTFILSMAIKLSFGQFYQDRCDSFQTCHQEQQFNKKITRTINRISSDSLVVVARYGGVGCRTRDLIIFYRKRGSNQIIFYRNNERSRKIILDLEDEEHLESFFDDMLYLTTDTAVSKYFFVNDGQTIKVMYRVGNHCGTYSIFPEFNENEICLWARQLNFPRLKE